MLCEFVPIVKTIAFDDVKLSELADRFSGGALAFCTLNNVNELCGRCFRNFQ